jgi:dynein light intermediate chain 1
LDDVAQRDDVPESHIFVLGDRGAGKRSLIQSINKNCVRAKNKFIEVEKMGSQFSALDFEFLYVKDLTEKDALTTTVTSEDNLPRMNVWVVQDTEKIDLLKMVMKPENLEFSSAVIVLDLDQPWEMMNSLNRWMSILDEAIRPTMMQLPIKK